MRIITLNSLFLFASLCCLLAATAAEALRTASFGLDVHDATNGADTTAYVEVYAGNFIGMARNPLANHVISAYINTFDDAAAVNYTTDADGFLKLQMAVGAQVFFTLLGTSDHAATTTPILIVPAEGFSGQHGRVAIQAPSVLIYDVFKLVINRKIQPDMCQLVVTITQFNTSYNVGPQGWPGVVATITPANYENPSDINTLPFYFGTWGPFSNATDPLPNNLTSTSWDGGVLFANIPVNPNQDIVIGGLYKSYQYTTAKFRCSKAGQFLNGAPNQGPQPNKPIVEEVPPMTQHELAQIKAKV